MKSIIATLVLASSLMIFGCRATAETTDYAVDYRYVIIKAMYPRMDHDTYRTIKYYSDIHNIKTDIICAIIDTESRWVKHATSPSGAKGLMQLMDGTAKDQHVINPYNVNQNIKGGVSHFAFCVKRAKGDISLAFKMYHGGHNRIKYGKASIKYSEICMGKTLNSKIPLVITM